MEGQLFDTGGPGRGSEVPAAEAPLAVRMRPRNLGELAGQEHVLGPGSALRTAIESGHPHSAILYGPPGSGKTTLARIAASGAEAAFEEESAVNAGRAEIRAVIERARERRLSSARPTILFLDEIHRFNKAQQDALLPAVEEGLLTLIGATTENPYFEVNSALLSRCQIYELQPIDPDQVEGLLRRALADPERGLADPPRVADEALAMLAQRSGGDARVALSALERAAERAAETGSEVDIAAAEDALQRKALEYDREGDRHYDYVSAWIKATRGSDVDASLYYLAVMLEGGEDPRFIARRMVILASEDIGNADPQALLVADAAARAVDRVGLPECALNLCPGRRLPRAGAEVERGDHGDLGGAARGAGARRQAPARLPPGRALPRAAKLGRGRGYVYPHDEPGGIADQPLLPEGLEDAASTGPSAAASKRSWGGASRSCADASARTDPPAQLRRGGGVL
jgi:putative ATPase